MAVFIALICIEALILIPSYTRREGEILSNLESTINTALSTAFSLNHTFQFGVKTVAEHAMNVPGIIGIRINFDSHEIAALGVAPTFSDSLLNPADTFRQLSTDHDFYDLGWVFPARVSGETYSVFVRADISNVQTELKNYILRIIGLILIVVAFLTVATIAILWPLILRPIIKLENKVSAIGSDALLGGSFVDIESRDDEIGGLYRSFQALLIRVSEAVREAVTAKEGLEEKVLERTSELQALNELLVKQVKETNLAKDRFSSFALSASDWYWEMDENLRFSYFSESFTSISGVSQDALLGLTRHENGNPGANEDSWQQHLDDLANFRQFKNFVHPRTFPGGRVVWLSINGTPVFDEQQEFSGYRGTGRDITETKEFENELRLAKEEADHANLAKTEFLSSMSHELRTPLNAILGFAQLLEKNPKVPLTAQQESSVKQILGGGYHLLNIIDDILDLAKIEAGEISVRMEHLNPRDIFKECLELMREAASERGITLSGKQETEYGVTADYIRLKQVILNLISNAIKYNNDGGSIVFGCIDKDDRTVRVYVSDSGNGIPNDKMSELFVPFNRLGKEETEIEGTGIGLSVSKKLVNHMGGEIGCDSVVGKGSTFWIDFPRAHSNTSRIEPDNQELIVQENTAYKALASKKILYIEDNPANLTLMEEIINRIEDVSMVSAHNAELGMVTAKLSNPDLIILDINLPGMNGFEALKQFRRSKETVNIPIIVLSAAATENDIKNGLDSGFQRYLTKPLDVQELTQTITSLLVSD